jgi:hypothetical protein
VAVCLVAGALSAAGEVLPPLKVHTQREKEYGFQGRRTWERWEETCLSFSLSLSLSVGCLVLLVIR